MPSEQPPTRVEPRADEFMAEYRRGWSDGYDAGRRFCPACREPAQPQPRGEGDAGKTRGYTREDIQANTWWPGKGGEGDDLATRLEDLASWLEPDSPFHGTIREAAQLARASTHPEQSERVDLEGMNGLSGEDQARLDSIVAAINKVPLEDGEKFASEDWEAPIYIGPADRDALTRALALIDQQEKALEAVDELADSITDEVLSGASWTGVLKAAIAYRSARSTSTKEDG